MAQLHLRFPDNQPGAFYVDRACINCNKCWTLAPGNFAPHPDGHSNVKSQPSTPAEMEACEAALAACPVGAIGKDGLEPGPPPMRLLMPGLWACGHPSELTDYASSYLIVRPEGNVLVDVPAFHPALVPQLEALGDLRTIFLTHADTIGEVDAFRLHFGAEVIMHEAEADQVYLGVDRPFSDSFKLFDDITVLHTPGHTPGSSSLLWHQRGGCLFSGDHLLPTEAGFGPVPYSWTTDWDEQLAQARRLLELPWHHAFPARGTEELRLGFVPQGKAKLTETLQTLR